MLRIAGLLSAVVAGFWLAGCSSTQSGLQPNWDDQVAYHSLVVASQYQEQIRVVVTRISMPGATPAQIESVAKPLEHSVWKLAGVKSVRTQSSDGGFLMEVHFNEPAGKDQLAEVRRVVDGFWQGKSTADGLPTVTLDGASLL
jgi:hypothetical protein